MILFIHLFRRHIIREKKLSVAHFINLGHDAGLHDVGAGFALGEVARVDLSCGVL